MGNCVSAGAGGKDAAKLSQESDGPGALQHRNGVSEDGRRPVLIVWDIENVRLPVPTEGFHPRDVVGYLKKHFIYDLGRTEYRTVTAVTERSLPQLMNICPKAIDELQTEATVLLASTYEKRNADVCLKKELSRFTREYGSKATAHPGQLGIVLVTGDEDFLEAAQGAIQQGFDVRLVHHTSVAAALRGLTGYGAPPVLWEDFLTKAAGPKLAAAGVVLPYGDDQLCKLLTEHSVLVVGFSRRWGVQAVREYVGSQVRRACGDAAGASNPQHAVHVVMLQSGGFSGCVVAVVNTSVAAAHGSWPGLAGTRLLEAAACDLEGTVPPAPPAVQAAVASTADKSGDDASSVGGSEEEVTSDAMPGEGDVAVAGGPTQLLAAGGDRLLCFLARHIARVDVKAVRTCNDSAGKKKKKKKKKNAKGDAAEPLGNVDPAHMAAAQLQQALGPQVWGTLLCTFPPTSGRGAPRGGPGGPSEMAFTLLLGHSSAEAQANAIAAIGAAAASPLPPQGGWTFTCSTMPLLRPGGSGGDSGGVAAEAAGATGLPAGHETLVPAASGAAAVAVMATTPVASAASHEQPPQQLQQLLLQAPGTPPRALPPLSPGGLALTSPALRLQPLSLPAMDEHTGFGHGLASMRPDPLLAAALPGSAGGGAGASLPSPRAALAPLPGAAIGSGPVARLPRPLALLAPIGAAAPGTARAADPLGLPAASGLRPLLPPVAAVPTNTAGARGSAWGLSALPPPTGVAAAAAQETQNGQTNHSHDDANDGGDASDADTNSGGEAADAPQTTAWAKPLLDPPLQGGTDGWSGGDNKKGKGKKKKKKKSKKNQIAPEPR